MTLEGFYESRLLSADKRARSRLDTEFAREAGGENILSDIAFSFGLFYRVLKSLYG